MKKIKNVDTLQCVGTLIFAIIAFCTILIPFEFKGLDFAFKHLPLFGSGDLIDKLIIYNDAFFSIIEIGSPLIMTYVANYCLYVFYGILAFDILFSLILLIFRSNVIRILCKIISILAGFIMIILTVLFLFYIAGFVINIAQNFSAEIDVLAIIQAGGVIYLFSLFVFAFLLISRQFKWFRRYF